MKVALVLSNLAHAGAQRSNVNLANLLLEAGHQVTVVTRAKSLPDFFVLDPRASRVMVDLEGGGRRNIAALRAALVAEAPDVVVASGNRINVRCLLACRGTGLPVVVVERNDPAQQPVGLKWELSRFWTYRWAARVVGISRGVLNYFWWIPQAQKVLLHNTFPPHKARRTPGTHHRIAGVGRLVPVKGFDRLVAAFARVAARFPDWTVNLWGDGEDRAKLEAQIQRLGLEGRVLLHGVTKEPLEAMAGCDFLAVPSRSEGFGNVLVEAMSVGLPVVSYDCPSGPRDILRSGVDGRLVPDGDEAAFAEALAELMENQEIREAWGQAALEGAERFRPVAHARAWLSLLGEVVGGKVS